MDKQIPKSNNIRFPSATVDIGGLPVGSEHPVRIQSMTNTPTKDVQATVQQVIRLYEAGCEYVRITAPGKEDARLLREISAQLRKRGCHVPLIADIHYMPAAAEIAARFVSKVRINPGNYCDKPARNAAGEEEFADNESELQRMAERMDPLFRICKEYGTAIRIGVNHGSLSSRIMKLYGDTPVGMAVSAMEYARICRDAGFGNVVLSIKSSNVKLMVYSYRLLTRMMLDEGLAYPLHIGVTEAGEGSDGRIRSAAGSGLLLSEGIGDTLRVSLSEEPENEIEAARKIISLFALPSGKTNGNFIPSEITAWDRRPARQTGSLGGDKPVAVIGAPHKPHSKPDYFFRDNMLIPSGDGDTIGLITLDASDISHTALPSAKEKPNQAVVAEIHGVMGLTERQLFYSQLKLYCDKLPLIVKIIPEADNEDGLMLEAAGCAAPFLTDGLADGLWIESAAGTDQAELTYAVLQACGARRTKTEYISCPTCGRTNFALTQVLRDVKKQTFHLRHLKIAVMGCIVNGPGEMADADYGYVGSGKNKVSIYKGKTAVFKNIPQEEAITALIRLIKDSGDWLDAD